MAISKARGCAYFALALFLVLGLSCYVVIGEMTTARVQAYKPAEAVARGDGEELRPRCSRFDVGQAWLCMEWHTYDNETINQPPYKLAIDVTPKTPDVERVFIDEIVISSNRGRRYAFADSIRWPVEVPLRPAEGARRKMEPAFHFDFGGGEEIQTRVRLRFVRASGATTVVVRTRWLPVVVKHFSPIV
ncbi:hypothetical protein [Longimicrobium sp.]|jgi:hypothetical protein|uniref:hypothetical protein n=1 Tax=Longimicrobium sp. TaxID=2029185 RepID=UPI002ED9AF55